MLVRRVLVTAAVFVSAVVVFGAWSCSKADHSGKTVSITVGSSGAEQDALIYVADRQRFFAAKGLDVRLRPYDTGLATTDAMLKNEVDMATAAEFVIVGKVLKKEKILDIATIAEFENEFLIGRTDKGIRTIGDLRGKKIGVTRHTSTEFSLSRFLDLHGMGIGQVTLVDIPPAKAVDAIVKGDVDALIAWEPNVAAVKERLGDRIVMWPAQNGQPKYWNVIARDAWVTGHPELVEGFLQSLAEAEKYLVGHPDEVKTMVEKRLHRDDSYTERIWPRFRFALTLDQRLIVAMKDEARWMISSNLTIEKTIPDFADYIYVDGLKDVKSGGVSIIR
jgi:NitT/TauT family transport system substrate-binding protein